MALLERWSCITRRSRHGSVCSYARRRDAGSKVPPFSSCLAKTSYSPVWIGPHDNNIDEKVAPFDWDCYRATLRPRRSRSKRAADKKSEEKVARSCSYLLGDCSNHTILPSTDNGKHGSVPLKEQDGNRATLWSISIQILSIGQEFLYFNCSLKFVATSYTHGFFLFRNVDGKRMLPYARNSW